MKRKNIKALTKKTLDILNEAAKEEMISVQQKLDTLSETNEDSDSMSNDVTDIIGEVFAG